MAVTDRTHPSVEAQPALSLLVFVAATLAGAHLAVVQQYDWFRDEFYYLACARRLAWGYVDHPPLVAFVAWVIQHTFGEVLWAIRLPSILAGAATVVLTGVLAARFGGGRYAQVLAAICVAIAPLYLFIFHFYSMNSLEVLIWTGTALAVVSVIRAPSIARWLLVGVLGGVGLLNKYSMGLFLAGIAAGVVLTDARRHLRSAGPWLAAGVAALMFLPHVLWEVANGWPTREFIRNAQQFKIADLGPIGFVREQLLQVHPLSAPVWIAGIALLATRREPWRGRLWAWCWLVVASVLVLQRAKAYYLGPIYPMLFAAGAVAIERAFARRRLARGAVVAVLVAGGLVTAPLTLPVLPVERFIAYQHFLGITPSSGERHRLGVLPQHYADMFGWRELAESVARAAARLAPAERETTAVFARNYGQAASLELFGPALGIHTVLSGHNNYWLWGPRDYRGDTLIVLGDDRETLLTIFNEVEEVGRTRCRLCMPYEQNVPVFMCRGWKRPIEEVWPATKSFN